MIGSRAVGWALAAALAAVLAAQPVAGHASTGIDAMLIEDQFGGVTPPVTLLSANASHPTQVLTTSTGTFTGACSPTIPGVSTDDGLGACQGANGGGSFTWAACGTGTIAASLTVTEPSGETASTSLTMVLVAGVGVAEGSYSDDGGSGLLAGVGILTPEPPTSCELGATQFQAQIALVGQH